MKKLNNSYMTLDKTMYSVIEPNQIEGQSMLYINEECAHDLSLDIEFLKSREALDLLVGNKSKYADDYIAQAYCGHQYGHFNVLGDGRALLLGEFDYNDQTYDIQLKGSGRTPYSRGGDGLGSVSSMMRELLMSEAMHGLKVPTTRSLTVIKTGNKIYRERAHEGAILTRIAKSHIRVGTFQYARMQDKIELIKQLADYTIERHYPQLSHYERKYRLLLRSVIVNQASLIAKWQSLGFIHGVMNTDNMTISGETIDYGPCAFMNDYDLNTVYSQIDRYGRYAFGKQPTIGLWNLTRFAETLLILLSDDKEEAIEIAKEELSAFETLYEESWLSIMFDKLGMLNPQVEDKALVSELLDLMEQHSSDYTNTFRLLSKDVTKEVNPLGNPFDEWFNKWIEQVKKQSPNLEEVQRLMQQSNPYIIPRNAWVEQVLKTDSNLLVEEFMEAFKNPFDYSGKLDTYTEYQEDRNYYTHCNT